MEEPKKDHHHIRDNRIDTNNISLFSFYRDISLILNINCLFFCEVALFSLPVLKAGNLSKSIFVQEIFQKHILLFFLRPGFE